MSKVLTQARSRCAHTGVRENLLESKELEFLSHKIFTIFCQVLSSSVPRGASLQ